MSIVVISTELNYFTVDPATATARNVSLQRLDPRKKKMCPRSVFSLMYSNRNLAFCYHLVWEDWKFLKPFLQIFYPA
jgi:hypothetical protein